MRNLRTWCLGVLAVAGVVAGCSNTTSNGGGYFLDAKSGCADAKSPCGGITPTADGESLDVDPDSALTADALTDLADSGADDSGADDAAAEDADPALDGFFDDPDTTTGGDGGALPNDCPERAKIVYVVTTANELLSFQPDKLQFKLVGKLKCPVSFGATPFSMSVDRQANAWVLYWDGSQGQGIWQVSTLDASCKATSYKTASPNIDVFGMGFSANGAGLTTETLYVIANNTTAYWTGFDYLASISFPGLNAASIAQVDFAGGAELTGNGLGELYGFFASSNPPSVRRIDKTTGKTNVQSWNLPTSTFGQQGDVAFAQWGGAFYLFYQGPADSSTNVWKLDTATGVATKVKANTGYTIVGAGVSSCAPTKAP